MVHKKNQEVFFASIAMPGGLCNGPGRDTPLNKESPEIMFVDTKPYVATLVVDCIHRPVSFWIEIVPPADVNCEIFCVKAREFAVCS